MSSTVEVGKKPETETRGVERTRTRRAYRPNADIIEVENKLLVVVDMPGLSSEDIDIHFEQGVLSIHGTVHDRQPEGTEYLWTEYGVGDYHRSFEVSEAVDGSKISAEYAHGILTLSLPKADHAMPRKIKVAGK